MTGMSRPDATWMQFSEEGGNHFDEDQSNHMEEEACEEVGGDRVEEDDESDDSETDCMQFDQLSFGDYLPSRGLQVHGRGIEAMQGGVTCPVPRRGRSATTSAAQGGDEQSMEGIMRRGVGTAQRLFATPNGGAGSSGSYLYQVC